MEEDLDVTCPFHGFSPFTLIYCTNLVQFDMSGCDSLDADEIVDCVSTCGQLEKISLAGCFQFSENQMVKMFTELKNLNDIDCFGRSPFQHYRAYFVVTSHPNLKRFIFEPKFPSFEKKDWSKFKFECKDVILGFWFGVCRCKKC